MQKEQLYLSFGTFAAHIQTHFWNEQESYFSYGDADADDDGADPALVDHDVSFRAGIGAGGQETFLPRALVFDLRDEFGALRTVGRLYDALVEPENEDEEAARVERAVATAVSDRGGAWNQPVDVLYTGRSIAPSRFQRALDEGEDEELGSDLSDGDDDGDGGLTSTGRAREQPTMQSQAQGQARAQGKSTAPSAAAAAAERRTRTGKQARRYWSDYARMPLHPRSLIRIGAGSVHAWSASSSSETYLRPMRGMSNVVEGEEGGGGGGAGEEEDGRVRFESFELGHRLARQLEKDQEISDDSLRWFAEDSDALQAFNVTATTSDAFSGFSTHFAELLKDEYHKTDLLLWATEWGANDPNQQGDDAEQVRLARIRRMNQALSAALLSEHADLYVPLTFPKPSQPSNTEGVASAPAEVHVNPRADVVNRLLDSANKARRRWDSNLGRADWRDMWHAAAFAAAHIETSTLPSRLRDRSESIPQLISRLNWRQNTRIGILGGCLPTPLLAEIRSEVVKEFDPVEAMLAARGYLARPSKSSSAGGAASAPWTPDFGRREVEASWVDFVPVHATGAKVKKKGIRSEGRAPSFASSITARDADPGARIPTTSVMEAWAGLPSPLSATHFVPLAYNVPPIVHPQLFTDLTSAGRALPKDHDSSKKNTNKRVHSLPLVSALSTSPQTARTLLSHRRFVQDVIRGHLPLHAFGIGSGAGASGSAGAASSEDTEGVVGGKDGLREVLERLEELLQGYEGVGGALEGEEEGEDEGRGTDEEWVEEGEAWDLDLD